MPATRLTRCWRSGLDCSEQQDKIDFNAGQGIAVSEYPTDIGPADYVLFVDQPAVGVIEAKPEDWGHKITAVEEQSGGYAAAKLKWVNNKEPLPFVYESTGVITRFTDGRDPKPARVRCLRSIAPRPMAEWLSSRPRFAPGCKHCRRSSMRAFATARSPRLKTWKRPSSRIDRARSFRWPPAPARPTRLSPLCIACSSTRMPSASCFWWTREPRRASRARVHVIPAKRRKPQVHRAL